jgi:molybdopterin molybdotransferase
VITFEEALKAVLELARPGRSEWVPIGEAKERVLAEPVIAQGDSPPSDVSAMDGYAVREADLSRFPVELQVQGEAFAGAIFDTAIEPGCCVRIFTGAAVPAGADRVVIQEVVRREDKLAVIDGHPGRSLHIRRAARTLREATSRCRWDSASTIAPSPPPPEATLASSASGQGHGSCF